MAADGYLNFDTQVDTKGFNKGTKSITNSLGGLRSALGKVAAAAAAAFSVKKLVDFGKSAVDVASDLQEVQNVVDTAFGDMAYKMEEFANTAVEQFGISRLTAKQTGSTFMAMASGMGVASDAASDMSVALTGLSADMASFYNVDQDVASTALKSVFTGETETLKQFGIVMTQANLEAFALEQGITKSYQAMTQAEKVQLRYAYVMRSTALAQGDFAKTSDGWANQTRILSEKWKEFSATVGTVLMNVLLPAVRTLNNAMTSLISCTQKAADALSSVFGISEQTSTAAGQLVDSSGAAADNYASMAESAEEAQKANDRTLASFDKVNKLSGDTSSSEASASMATNGGSLTANTDTESSVLSVAENKFARFFESLKSSFSTLFVPLKDAWESSGTQVIDSAKRSFGEMKDLAGEIGGSFASVWTNGSGQKSLEYILGIFTNINTTVGNIAGNIKEAWTEENLGTGIIQNLADAFNTLLEHAEKVSENISDWSSALDFQPILTSVYELTDALEPLTDSIGEGLEWLFDDVLLPLSTWTIQDAAPAAIDTLASALDAFGSIIDAFKPFGEWLWDSFLQPIASWTGGVIVSVLEAIGGGLQTISDLLSGELSLGDFIKNLDDVEVFLGSICTTIGVLLGAEAIGGLISTMPVLLGHIIAQTTALIANAAAWVAANAPIVAVVAAIASVISIGIALYKHWDELKEQASLIWENIKEVLYGFFDAWTLGFGIIVETSKDAVSGITSCFSSIGQWFSDRAADIQNAFFGIDEWFGAKFQKAWSNIKSAFSLSKILLYFKLGYNSIVGWFQSLPDTLKEKFLTAWQNIKKAFDLSSISRHFDAVKNRILSPFESIKEGIKNVLNWIIDKLNSLIGKINSFGFDLPDILGGGHVGFDIPEIPKLARGAVIPPNHEFLAILGDQKRGTNIETPLATMIDAFKTALRDIGGSSQSQPIVVICQLDGREVYRTVVKENRANVNATGVNELMY